jgi:integrase/recombinase XerC
VSRVTAPTTPRPDTGPASWFVITLPGLTPLAHLLDQAHHGPGSRASRCGERSRAWRRTADPTIPRCPACQATLAPPRPHRRRAPVKPELSAQYVPVLDRYTTALAEADFSAGTRRIYASRVRGFLAFLDTADRGDLEGRDPLEDPFGRNYAVREFTTHLRTEAGAKPTTINNYRAALDHFYGFHLGLGAAVADRARLSKWAPKALQPLQRKKFLRAAERTPSRRDAAICLTLYFTGLRISELAALDIRDVMASARRCKLIVRDGKGNIYREIPGMHPLARTALNNWLQERPLWISEDSGETALFLGRRGTRLADRSLREIVVAVGAAAGLGEVDGEPFGPHTLRHTLATILREQGYDLSTIKQILGHSSIEVTSRYTMATHAEAAQALEDLVVEL